MKHFVLVLFSIAAAGLLASCGDSSTTQSQGTNAASGNVLVNSKQKADKTIDVSYLNQAVQLFNVQEGRYPKDLQELTPKYVAKIPDLPPGWKLEYDSTKGEVKAVQQ